MFNYKYLLILIAILPGINLLEASSVAQANDYEDYSNDDYEITPLRLAQALGKHEPAVYDFKYDTYSTDSEDQDNLDTDSVDFEYSDSETEGDSPTSLSALLGDPQKAVVNYTPENNPDLYAKFLLQHAILEKKLPDEVLADRLINLEIRRQMQSYDEIDKMYTDLSQARLAANKKLKAKQVLDSWDELVI